MSKIDFDEIKDKTDSKMVDVELQNFQSLQQSISQIEELNKLGSQSELLTEGNKADDDLLAKIDKDIIAQADQNLFESYKANLTTFTMAIMFTIPGSCIHYMWYFMKLEDKI